MNSNSAPTTHNKPNSNNANNTMSAGCSKFPALNSSNNNNVVGSDQSLSNSSPTNHQQLIDNVFPSPPSTSSQPSSSAISLVQTPRSHIQHSKSATTTSNPPINHANRPPSGNNFFNFLFRSGRNKDSHRIQNFISNEGSITIEAWQRMSKKSSVKIRLQTLETLSMISQQRKLQVSTLEGIWTETHDLLDDPIGRLPFLQLIYTITVSQITEIGLALRLTFFETIRSIGLNDITIRWLVALSDNGKCIEPFEMSVFELLATWLENVVLDNNENTTSLAPNVLQLCSNLIRVQHAFIDEESLSKIIKCCCKRIVRGPGDQLGACLSLLDAVFDNCVIHKSELYLLVTSLCFIICLDLESDKIWNLFISLLVSEHSYAVLELLQSVMQTFVTHSAESQHDVAVQIARGAVHALAQALWGTKRIESLNCSPCVVLPAFEAAMFTDVLVARQVMHAIRRLVVKHGKTLNVLNWSTINRLLSSAVQLCSEDIETAVIVRVDLHSILSIIESLIDREEYAGNTDEFYDILEDCVIDRPDCSAINLMDYRINQLTPEHEDWIEKVYRLLTKFLYEGTSLVRREKAIYLLHNFYKKYRLYEPLIVNKIVLPICSSMILKENDASIQYYLICVLFDVAKLTKIQIGSSNSLFMSVLNAISSIFTGLNLENDNLEVATCYLSELLDERWACFDMDIIDTIFNIMIRHLELNYIKTNGSTCGCEVRQRLFESLLLFSSHPLNGQIARVLILTSTQFKPIYNPRVIRAGPDTQGQFRWTSICEITTLGLQTEAHWPTLERLLEFLSGLIEHRLLVYTAGVENVNKLVNAVLSVVVDERFPVLPKSKLARYLCPVLGKLVNYNHGHDNQICKVIVNLIRSSSPQSLMASAAAIQVLPDKMAVFNRSLLENLASLKPMAQLAIPIIELLNDAADVFDFHEFFQEKHFKVVINILAPYSNARQYNTFIVTSIYQTAFKWFICVPLSSRPCIAAHIFGSFARVNDLFPLQKPSESPKSIDTTEKCLFKNQATLMTKESERLPEVDSHPTALIITPSKKRSNIKKLNNDLQGQNSLENDLNMATSIGEFFLQTLSDSPKSLERNPSGDGRMELPFDDPTPLFSTGDSVSLEIENEIEDFKGVHDLAQQILAQEYNNQQQDARQNKSRESFTADLTIECLENLNYFIRFFRNKTIDNCTVFSNRVQSVENNGDLVEKCVENWVVDGTILTLKIFVRPEISTFGLHSRRIATISVDRLDADNPGTSSKRAALAIQVNRMNRSMSREKTRTATTSIVTPKRHARNPSITSKESDDLLRRRHQSTKASPQKSSRTSQPPEEMSQVGSDTEDVFLNSDQREERTPEFIQLVIRHVFGKESYVMRSFVDIPLDFDNALGYMNSDPTSLLLHLRGNHSAVHLQEKDNELIARSLRFLDTMPSEELHQVAVIYLRKEHSNMNDILVTEYGSDRFVSFVHRLGKPVTCKEDGSNFGYEHVDLLQRIRFHVTTMSPCTTEAECQEKRQLIESTQICVVFNESGNPCKLNQLFRLWKDDQVTLEVIPQDQSSVTINVHARKEISWWLAMTRTLLPDNQAAHVLRKMVVRAQRSWLCWSSLMNEESSDMPYLSCAVNRQRHIHKLRKRGVQELF